MRADVSIQKQSYQGREYWVIKDPISLKYYRFEEEEYFLLQMLDGTASPDQIKRRFDYEFAPQKLTLQELYQFVGMLYRSCLLVSQAPNQGLELKARGEKNRKQEFRASITNVLALRFKGFDPDRILTWMNGYTKYFFTWPAFILVLLFGLSALGLIFTQFETFQNRLPSFQEFFAAKNWIWLALVLAFTKVFHEFGHGLACKRFGGECHEMGVMLLVLTPCLYCNVSDSWMLPSKWKRAFIAAAGMYVELVLASIAVFVWWFSEPGMVNQLALNVIFVSSTSTILFNANPLLRYDGYYILSDLLEIPNLRQKATSILQRSMGAWMLGIKSTADPFLPARHKWAFGFYSVAAAAYRWLITFSIFWFVYSLLEPYGLKLIGQLIALTALYGLLGMPLIKLYKFFSVPGRFGTVKPIRAIVSTAVVGFVVAAVLLIPLPHHVYCSFYVQAEGAAKVYVDLPGVVDEIHVTKNQKLEKQSAILTLKSPELKKQVLTMQNQVRSAMTRINTIQVAANFDRKAADKLSTANAEYQAAQSKLTQRLKDLPLLTIRAPIAGVLIAPPETKPQDKESGTLETWTGTPLDKKNVGAYYDQKTLVGQIVPDLKKLEVVLAIDQADIEFIQQDQKVELMVNQLPATLFESKTNEIAPQKMKSVPKALSSKHGGDLVTTTDSTGKDVPQQTTYMVTVPLSNDDELILPGSVGVAKIRTGTRTIGWRMWRLACRTFRFEL